MSIAILFPGQGSQSVGMLDALPASFQATRKQWVTAASQALDFDVDELISTGPEDQLNQTAITQPVLLTVNHILWSIWQQQHPGDSPLCAAGHSLGEFSALVAAGSLEFGEAVRLVAKRGQLMQNAVPAGAGAMAAILGLPNDVVEAICREVAEDEVVSPANYNSPGQLVIAGHAPAVERAMLQAKAAGAKRAVVLPVSVPSHCHLMSEAASELRQALEVVEFKLPRFPIIHNVDAKPRETVDKIREALIQQLAEPVQWTSVIKSVVECGVETALEIGPGRVLTGLGKRIDKSIEWSSYLQELEA